MYVRYGFRSIATPIRDGNGKVIAAINCSAHAGRISKEVMLKEFLPLLQENATKISEAMKIIKN
ncbi:IclR family transcriptional regulator domain-containing protein [Psychrobacillus sp. FSL H8-0487]|uniref:IclR family transcriptional regulator domain-containing protein n=1 Tax=Psychrobacillus sp. FSL H8-0487 TaxID=2921391 RepID=UPI004046959A